MNIKIAIVIVIYFLTGVITTLLTQLLTNEGLNHSTTLIRPFVNYVGNMFAILLPTLSNSSPSFSVNSFISLEVKTVAFLLLLSLFDLSNSVFTASGISQGGSGLFQVVYSSAVIWVALLSLLFLKRQLSIPQWMGIALCCSGLFVSSYTPSSNHQHHYQSENEEEEVAVTNTGKTIPFHVLKEGQYYQRIFISNPPSDLSSPGTNQQQQPPPKSQRHHEVSSYVRERYMGEGAKEGFFLRYKQLVTSSTHLPTSSNLPPLSLPSSSSTTSNSSESPFIHCFHEFILRCDRCRGV